MTMEDPVWFHQMESGGITFDLGDWVKNCHLSRYLRIRLFITSSKFFNGEG